jgi:hypothetical protein
MVRFYIFISANIIFTGVLYVTIKLVLNYIDIFPSSVCI